MTAAVLNAEVGHVFEGRARTLTMARALALSGGAFDAPGWPDKNLHTDLQAAQDVGLAAVVVSGTQWEGYLVGFLVELCGLCWFRDGELEIKIPRSVKIGEAVRPKARLERVEPRNTGVRVVLTAWCENQDGEQVMVGCATCTLQPSADQE